MPHFIIEYSANLQPEIRMPDMMACLRDAALQTGVFELPALRIRAEPREQYLLADGDPSYGFIHLLVRIRAGRDEATKQRVGETLLAAMNAHLAPIFAAHPLALLIELQDVSPTVFVHNTLNERVGRS
jgi:5-carboxymethyl-2-hydroxymuconate isomerase